MRAMARAERIDLGFPLSHPKWVELQLEIQFRIFGPRPAAKPKLSLRIQHAQGHRFHHSHWSNTDPVASGGATDLDGSGRSRKAPGILLCSGCGLLP